MVTCTDAVKEAVTSLNRVVSTRDVINYIYKKYPDKPWKENSIQCHLMGLSVNHTSSRHYPTQRRQACLFYVGRGKYRLYDPENDGRWVVDDKGVHLAGEENNEDIEDEETFIETTISLERDLEDHIIRNLDQIEDGLKLYSRDGLNGRQFNTDVGRVDILAIDKNNNFVVIELKAGKAHHSVISQILVYMSWVRQNIADGKEVRGIVIADDFDKKLMYGASETPNISLKKYEVNFTFKDIEMKFN